MMISLMMSPEAPKESTFKLNASDHDIGNNVLIS